MEISRFATEILRHGNFPVYPVEPVERHGKEVSLVPCRKEKMVLETVKKSSRTGRKRAMRLLE